MLKPCGCGVRFKCITSVVVAAIPGKQYLGKKPADALSQLLAHCSCPTAACISMVDHASKAANRSFTI